MAGALDQRVTSEWTTGIRYQHRETAPAAYGHLGSSAAKLIINPASGWDGVGGERQHNSKMPISPAECARV